MTEVGKILSGIFLVIVLHIAVFLIGGLIAYIASFLVGLEGLIGIVLFAALGIGITQLIYIIPVIIWLRRQRKWGLMKGVIIGAVLTVLLNGGCWLWVSVQLR